LFTVLHPAKEIFHFFGDVTITGEGLKRYMLRPKLKFPKERHTYRKEKKKKTQTKIPQIFEMLT
jgi:hypothetical protein